MVIRYSHVDQDFKKQAVTNLVQSMPQPGTIWAQNENHALEAKNKKAGNLVDAGIYEK